MAKVSVRLRHVSWREGRPRFNPGPKLRALGYKGEDMKRADGRWMGIEEAAAFIAAREAEIAQRRARKADGKRLAPLRAASIITTADLFTEYFGSTRAAARAPKTLADYRSKAQTLADFAPDIWAEAAAAISKPVAFGLHEKLWAAKGLHTANGVIAVARLVWSYAEKRGKVDRNPFLKLGMPTPPPRQRCGTPDEIAALLAAADGPGDNGKPFDPEIGDAIILALYSGQRQGDVLAYEPRNEAEGRIRLIQNKTGARVSIQALAPLADRLRQAAERKTRANITTPVLVADTRTGRPFNAFSFRHRYAALRDRAAKACPSVASLRFQDLRDTAVTRLAMSGCTLPEIASITGHSLETITTILKHYLELNEAIADAATQKLAAWLEKEGVAI